MEYIRIWEIAAIMIKISVKFDEKGKNLFQEHKICY